MKFQKLSSIDDLREDQVVFLVNADGDFAVGKRRGQSILIGTLLYAWDLFTHFCVPEVA